MSNTKLNIKKKRSKIQSDKTIRNMLRDMQIPSEPKVIEGTNSHQGKKTDVKKKKKKFKINNDPVIDGDILKFKRSNREWIGGPKVA